MRKLLVPALVAAALLVAYLQRNASSPAVPQTPAVAHSGSAVSEAFASHAREVEVEESGTVVAVLRDDDEGSRHQRFLVRADSGPTVLVAHNIDLAQRVPSLRKGDRISFRGQYVWNDKGGVVHWTHRDPSGHHEAGWLKRNGETFQ